MPQEGNTRAEERRHTALWPPIVGHLEASRAASARGIGQCRRPDTGKRRGRSCANTDERHETHGEGAIEVMVGKLREGMGREPHAGEGMLRHGCGREAMPVPGGTACHHSAVAEALAQGCRRGIRGWPRRQRGASANTTPSLATCRDGLPASAGGPQES